MIIQYVLAFIIPVIIALVATPLVIKLAVKIGATDQPGGRKIHKTKTPRLGGLAVFISLFLSIAIVYLVFPELFAGIEPHTKQIAVIAFSLISIFLLGFWDDLKSLKPGIKFGVQFLTAALVYYAGFRISNITNPLDVGLLDTGMLDFPITLFWIVGITNAFNLIDGLDGLSSGVATIACISIFTVSSLSGELWTAILALILAGALVGFLRYNFRPASIFLGDSGSLLIGFSLALMSIQSTTKISTGFALLFPMLVLGLPITDTVLSMMRRFLSNYLPEKSRGKSTSVTHKIRGMFVPDKSHIHHQLLSLGLTHRNTVLLLYSVSAFFASAALILVRVESIGLSIALMMMLGIILVIGIKKLRYREISIFNNGMIIPVYEQWILNRTIFLSLLDMSFIAASFGLSYNFVQSGDPALFLLASDNMIIMAVLPVQLFIFWITGLYRETIRQMGIGNALHITTTVGYAILGSALVLLVMDVIAPITILLILVLDFYFLLTFILGFRIAYRALSYWFHREKPTGENVLIYGANENGAMILHKIHNSVTTNFKVLGFLDDDPELEGKMMNGYPIIGTHWKLARVHQSQGVDNIFICEKSIKPENFARLKSIAKEKGIHIKRLQVKLKSVTATASDKKKNNGVTEFDLSYT
ncbi:MAG: hypothetical protein WD604_14010 [Balneolaceae bacterium]